MMDGGIMKAPDYLAPRAKGIYKEIYEFIEGWEAIASVDHFAIAMMADSIYWFQEACRKVNANGDDGPTQTFNNQTTNINAWHTVKKTSHDQFLKLSAKLGMSPKDREAILKFKGAKKETDKLD